MKSLEKILGNQKQRGIFGEIQLENLLSNVLPPEIFQMQYSFKNGEMVDAIIKVNDNGEGISEENMPRLFQRFFRVDISRSRGQGGSGLGLAIVKHIIDAHNENIYVQSTVGIGSEFSFSLKKSKVL